jgi:uncharacterized membrane protein
MFPWNICIYLWEFGIFRHAIQWLYEDVVSYDTNLWHWEHTSQEFWVTKLLSISICVQLEINMFFASTNMTNIIDLIQKYWDGGQCPKQHTYITLHYIPFHRSKVSQMTVGCGISHTITKAHIQFNWSIPYVHIHTYKYKSNTVNLHYVHKPLRGWVSFRR